MEYIHCSYEGACLESKGVSFDIVAHIKNVNQSRLTEILEAASFILSTLFSDRPFILHKLRFVAIWIPL